MQQQTFQNKRHAVLHKTCSPEGAGVPQTSQSIIYNGKMAVADDLGTEVKILFNYYLIIFNFINMFHNNFLYHLYFEFNHVWDDSSWTLILEK